ncbi:MAG: hypothetical protein ACE5HS_10275 [bacterium]
MIKYILPLLALFAACSEQTEKTTQQNAEPPSLESSGVVSWTMPAGWIKETSNSPFRKAQYRLPKVQGDPEDASCILFYFQGEGGGVEANIRRWYSQFTQPDGRTSEEVARVTKTKVNNLNQTIIDLTGTYLFKTRPLARTHTEKPGFRMLASIIETSAGPYFIKLVGPEKTVAWWKDSFYEFTKSFKE